jgi:hypothetical protein
MIAQLIQCHKWSSHSRKWQTRRLSLDERTQSAEMLTNCEPSLELPRWMVQHMAVISSSSLDVTHLSSLHPRVTLPSSRSSCMHSQMAMQSSWRSTWAVQSSPASVVLFGKDVHEYGEVSTEVSEYSMAGVHTPSYTGARDCRLQ